jgi:hypothetical protein
MQTQALREAYTLRGETAFSMQPSYNHSMEFASREVPGKFGT